MNTPLIIYVNNPAPAERPHHHRPAYLVDGGIACYDCGARLG